MHRVYLFSFLCASFQACYAEVKQLFKQCTYCVVHEYLRAFRFMKSGRISKGYTIF